MSLYYDAASVLTSSQQRGSLKSRIYAKDANLKSKPAHVYALISETAKYDTFLKEVVDHAGILAHEPKLTPLLALLLMHDCFFAKGGVATSASHPLRQAIERHKARLQSEFTKARLRRRIPDVERLKIAILKEKGLSGRAHPRWARVNTLKSPLEAVVKQHFASYEAVQGIDKVIAVGKNTKVFHHDLHVPNLLAFPPDTDLTRTQAYLSGEIILQDKASCFPAHLLVGNDGVGRTFTGGMDGCAAPGNKTTHMAALIQATGAPLYACERDVARSKTLQMMVDKAGANKVVKVLVRQDFLALDPKDRKFENVTHLLLDPSCSGSGILGREDIPKLSLPDNPRKPSSGQQSLANNKKRKRGGEIQQSPSTHLKDDEIAEEALDEADAEGVPVEASKARLEKLSNLQSRIVEHAFSFPAARRVTYSTCSIHVEENEAVVHRVLTSEVGENRGWRVLRREDQVHGLQAWNHRGADGDHGLSDEQRAACIRCTPDDGEGTMGFFVCGFVREDADEVGRPSRSEAKQGAAGDEDEWDGFSDS